MKANSIYIIVFSFTLFSCNQILQTNNIDNGNSVTKTSKVENFDWLLGEWKRSNEKDGKDTFELWNKRTSSEYFGVGYTIQNGDTISKEEMQLVMVNNKWNLIVTVPESKPVTFTGISHDKNHFICENKLNDFPHRIKYWKNGTKLSASISADDIEIPFEFEKINIEN